jgi:hypothetical protein
LLIDKTSSMYLNVWLKDTASFLLLSRNRNKIYPMPLSCRCKVK